MQIRMKDELTNEELRELLDRAEAECEAKDQCIAALEAIVQRRDAVIAVLERDVRQLELQMESIGAGGVSGRRITDPGTLAALQTCERTYHQMMVSGTPDNCYAHDKAREQFWRVFGGEL